jgi:hypothetical protein
MARLPLLLVSLYVTSLACTEVRKTCLSSAAECHEDLPVHICEEWDAKMINDARWKVSEARCAALGFEHVCAERMYTRDAEACAM